MVATRGWEPEPTLADALAGSGGMADPVEPTFASSLVADTFPDALSVLPLPRAARAPGLPAGSPAAALAPSPRAGPAPTGRTVPAPARAAPPPTGRRVPLAPPAGSRAVQMPAPARPWSQFPPPGAPATQYVPVPTSAQLAPGTGRRPVAGVNFPVATPRPVGPSAPINPVRPPAYLPQNQGMTQVRAAIAQARQSSRRSTGSSSGRPGRRKKASGAWGFLLVLLIVLVSSGLGQKIIDAISQLLQRK